MIHHSHSKRDLIELCEVFNIELLDIYDLNKEELVKELELQLEHIDYIEPETDYYHIETIDELIEYLETPNQTKNLTIPERERMITIARDILLYCKNGFQYRPKFKDLDDVITKAELIAPHGDITTIRRALLELKMDTKIKNKIEPVISNKVKKQLEKKKRVKALKEGQFFSTRGSFKVIFD